MNEVWNVRRVRLALSEAYKILLETERGVGNLGIKGYWPDIPASEAEMWYSVWTDANTNNKKQNIVRRQRSSIEIMNMEHALIGSNHKKHGAIPGWGQFLQGMDGYRLCLFKFAILKATNRRIRPYCKKVKIAYSTFNRQRDKGAEVIAAQLNRLEIPVWREIV